MKLWVTRYALTKGLFQAEFEDVGSYVREISESGIGVMFFNRDRTNVVQTVEEARLVASEMASAKIASLEKQIIKLRKLVREPKVMVR